MRKSKYSKEELINNVIYGLGKMDIATIDDIIFIHHKHLQYGNVVFDKGMEEKRNIILKKKNEKLKESGIVSII